MLIQRERVSGLNFSTNESVSTGSCFSNPGVKASGAARRTSYLHTQYSTLHRLRWLLSPPPPSAPCPSCPRARPTSRAPARPSPRPPRLPFPLAPPSRFRPRTASSGASPARRTHSQSPHERRGRLIRRVVHPFAARAARATHRASPCARQSGITSIRGKRDRSSEGAVRSRPIEASPSMTRRAVRPVTDPSRSRSMGDDRCLYANPPNTVHTRFTAVMR